MPGHAFHLQIAQACWQGATDRGADLPELTPVVRNALYQGAIGPDMGYFPRSDPFLTGLAHYVNTAQLVKALHDRVSTDVERAYAVGWLTHFLADTMIHPLVNEACGERIHGTRNRPATYEDSTTMHMRVELGLDSVRLFESPEICAIRVGDVFDEESIRYLADAYTNTYGIVFTTDELLDAHRAVSRWQGRLFRAMQLIGRRHSGRRLAPSDWPMATIYFPIRWATGLTARSSPTFGFTHTFRPADWFAREADAVAANAVPERFAAVLGNIDDLDDLNLDTGLGLDAPYGPRESTLELLASRTR